MCVGSVGWWEVVCGKCWVVGGSVGEVLCGGSSVWGSAGWWEVVCGEVLGVVRSVWGSAGWGRRSLGSRKRGARGVCSRERLAELSTSIVLWSFETTFNTASPGH